MKEIGSIYSLSQTPGFAQAAGNPSTVDGCRRYSLCREALLDMAVHLKLRNKRIIMPAYTCQTVLDPFQQENWDCRFFNVTEDLRLDCKSVLDLVADFEPSVCLVHPYYGADLDGDELDCLRKVKSTGVIMVCDLTQCLFSTSRPDIFDIFVGSYRKWYPVPDGGFLQLASPITELDQIVEDYDENETFVTLQSDAMYMRGAYLRSSDCELKEISRRLGNMSMASINGRIVPHRMSGYSCSIVDAAQKSDIISARKENYAFLHDSLKDIQSVQLVRPDIAEVTCAPLYFPIYVDDRSSLQKALCGEHIFAPVLWPVKTNEILVSDTVKYIFSHILAIPCDQRYDLSDMTRLVNAIEKLI